MSPEIETEISMVIGKGLLQVCSKRSWRDIPLYLADSRQDMAAILAIQADREATICRGN